MKLQEFIDKNFAGNVSNFAKAYGVTRQTVYNLLSGQTFPQTKLREALKRKGVRFDKQEAVMNELNEELKHQADLIIRSGKRCFVISKNNEIDVCDVNDYEARKRSGWEYVGETFNGENY